MQNRLFMQSLLSQPELMQGIMSFNHTFKQWITTFELEQFISDLKTFLQIDETILNQSPSPENASTLEQTAHSNANDASLDWSLQFTDNLALQLSENLTPYIYELSEQSANAEQIRLTLLKSNAKLCLFKRAPTEFFLFDNIAERLCLLSSAELDALCLYIGASRYGQKLSQVIWKKERDLLLNLIPNEYAFAVSLGQFLISQLGAEVNFKTDEFIPFKLKIEGLRSLSCVTKLFQSPLLQAYLLQNLINKQHEIFNELQQYDLYHDYAQIQACFPVNSTPQVVKVLSLSRRILEQKVDEKWKLYLS